MNRLFSPNQFGTNKLVLTFILFFIAFWQSNVFAQGTYFVPATHISGTYQHDGTGRVKVRALYMDHGDWLISSLKLYYKSTDGTFKEIMTLSVNNINDIFPSPNPTVWSDGYNGASAIYAIYPASGMTVVNGFKTNEGDLHYFDFMWNVPADAYANNIITISSDGQAGSATWTKGGTNLSIVQYPILTPPSGLMGTDQVHCDKVSLSWSLPSSFPGSYSQELYKNNTKIATLGSNVTSYDDNNVGNETNSYFIKAIHYPSSGGNITSINSNPTTGSKKPGLSAPAGITVSNNDCSGSINLTWSYYSSNPSNFKIYEATSLTGTYTLVATVDGGERSYTRAATSRNTTYYYKVSTVGLCGETVSTNGYPGMSPTTPSAPTNVSTSVNLSNTGIIVTWTDNSTDETGFIIERTVQGGGGTTSFNVGANTTTFTDLDASKCVNYVYVVRAKNNCQPGGVPSVTSSTNRMFPDLSTSFNSTTNKLKCSKGYFPNMVQLEWSTPNVDVISQYRVYRKVYGSNSDSVIVGTANIGEGTYFDNTAASGVLYKYTLVGVLNCAGTTRYSNITEDVGFRSASGTVSGRITYQGGFALNNARVTVTPAATSFLGASMLLNGSGLLLVPNSSKLTFSNGIVAEAWFKTPSNSGTQNILVITSGVKTFTVRLSGDKVEVSAYDGSSTKTLEGSTSFLTNNFNQVTASLRSDSMYIYLNGIRVGGTSVSSLSLLPLNNSSVRMGALFSGNLDEVRLFNGYKTNSDVRNDYGRKVSPGEDGLCAYYMFDENVVGYNGFFDYSKVGSVYNENHGTVNNTTSATFNTSTPSTSQLAFASYTDETGSYIVSNVGYSQSGQVFTVTPSFETHAFSPVNRTVFIGEGSIVHNQQDFIDQSSFQVTGNVYYAGTSCPAEGIRIKVDGDLVVYNGDPVTTNNSGQFDIQVPVGNHIITLEKEGHVFSAGRFPSSGTYNFQGVVPNIQFRDSTFIKVVGRAVGGAIEAAKKPGLGLSVNNIGKTRVTFKSQLGNGCSTVSVTTNDTTGEYVAYLPPLIYTIDTAYVLTNPVLKFGTQSVLDLTRMVNRQSVYDTTYVPSSGMVSKIDSVSFHTRRDFIYYTTPQISISRKFNRTPTDSAFIGELALAIDSVNSIPITPVNPFTYPVFKQYKEYYAKIFAYDEYENRDRFPSTVRKVPLDGVLLIVNDLTSSELKNTSVDVTDGFGEYAFRVALPSLDASTEFTKTMQATFFTTANIGTRNVNWLPGPGGTNYKAIVFGGKTRGSNFITKGPEKVELVLRDPPGSASSATWAKNTSYNSIKRYSTLNNSEGGFMGTVQVGAKWESGVAFGGFFGIESEIAGGTGQGFTKSSTSGTNGEIIENITSALSISTGGGPDQVGSKADVFYGYSTNYTIGLADNLVLVEEALCNQPGAICGSATHNGYKIGLKQSLSINPRGVQTIFAYTTGEIEDIVIPNLIRTRNIIFSQAKKANGQPRYVNNFTNTADPLYDRKYAANNDDLIFGSDRNKNNPLVKDTADRTGPSYTFRPDQGFDIDSVRMFNDQIRLWKEALAKNEREKYLANEFNIGVSSASNVSIGKAALTREFSSTRTKEETTYEELYLAHDQAYNLHATSGGSGLNFDGSATIGETKTTDEGSSSDTTVTVSYTLNDGDDGDLISVNIINTGSGNGHMFKLIGGQTSCPFEGPEYAHYYKPTDTVMASTYYEKEQSVKLTEGTAQRHVPKIQVPQPIKFNVPADQAATFTLQLGNESESDDDQTYKLQIVEVTNPHGAVITIDGLDPNREFTVPFASSLMKTLSVKRGVEHYDYDNILILYKSPCDDDIVDSAYISVHFIPTCTQPSIYTPGDKWTLNNSFRDTMNVIITGYDYNFGGFKNVTFQYKPSSSSQWNILETFKKIPADSTERDIPTIQPYIEYAWNMKQLVDGPYDIRAVSTCTAPGYLDATKESSVFSGLADRVNPSPFGNPSPADGILSPNDEIQIQFNEPVDNASLTYQNFDIRGVLNGSALQNTASIYFDGNNDHVEIPTGLNLAKKTFSLEFWAKRQTLGEQVVFSQGVDAAQYLSIGFDAQNKFNFRIGNGIVKANLPAEDTLSFHHYTVSYNFDTDMCELFVDGIIANTGNTMIYNKYEGGGKTIIGKLAKDNNLFFTGNLRDFRLWGRTRTSADITGSINLSLKGTEAGILANWRMDEADGLTVKDYIRSRHATLVNAVWEINPKGKSYRVANEPIAIAAADLAFTEEKDFTIEFWFKGANTGGNTALFSNGRGDSTDANPLIRWSIEKDANGKIFVKHRGLSFEAVSTNFFDGNWHHFALVMQRATSIAAYVDGNQQNSTYPGDFKQFGGNKIWIGARGFQPPGLGDVLDRTFDGYIDEVRIWNSARKQEQIDRDRVNRLAATEADLVFYMPFELYTLNLGVPILTGSLSDVKSPSRVITGATANGSGLNSETPKIKLQRPVQSINFTYSVNQDKIILTPTTLPALIENVTLDITVKDVYDRNGNKMQSPKTWIAYVDKNQVKWQDQEFNFTKKRGEALTFTSNIVNSGGAIKQFDIQNLPAWLTASPASGTVSPNSFKTIQFTVDPNVNIGNYENEIQLLTDFGFPDGLLIKLKVFAPVPSSWAVNPAQYQNSMSIVGQIRVNNVISANPDDVLAAFINGECRGLATLQYYPQIDRYFAFLNVYSNAAQGENIEFKIWNSGAGKIHSDVTPQIQFVSNSQIGTISAPQIFNASDKLTRYIPLKTGWNWISFNLSMKDSNDLNRLFYGLQSTNGDMVKSQTQFADYTQMNGWAGSLGNAAYGIKPQPSYRFRSSVFDTLVISGIEIDPTTRPIKLDSGWNWLGFISQRNLSVTEALSSHNAVSGDLVKSQTQFAVYDASIGWVGSLTTMIPNVGYMYRSGANATFAYPKSAMFGKKATDENLYTSNFFKLNATAFEKNMNAVVDAGACNAALASGRLSLGAYVGTELRGVTHATTMSNGRNLYFISIGSNSNEPISFKLQDEKTGEVYELDGEVSFDNNKVAGTIDNPVTLGVSPSFSCNKFSSSVASSLSAFVYPNPFKGTTRISVNGFKGDVITVKVFDITGKLLDTFTQNVNGSTTANIDWTPQDRNVSIDAGVYFIEVSTQNGTVRTKVVKY